MAKSNTKSDRSSKSRRPVVHRSQSPSLVPPLLALAGYGLIAGVLDAFHLVGEQLLMLVTAGVVVLFAAFICVYQVYFKFKAPLARNMLLVALPVWIAGSFYVLHDGIVFPDPVYQGALTRADRELKLSLPDGSYWLYVRGEIPVPEEAPTPAGDDDKKGGGDPNPGAEKTFRHQRQFRADHGVGGCVAAFRHVQRISRAQPDAPAAFQESLGLP
ncbi:MAG: hypothetical protein M5R36_03130 [Deltaproteobacteria bacterium]|nr:hypothetical protein [Deltaproteobacteria bacterium]